MIHFKKHNVYAFSLIEVMVALAIMGILMSAIFMQQGSVFKGVVTSSTKGKHLLAMRQFLDDIRLKKAQGKKIKKEEKKLQDPEMKMTYELKQLSEKSSLKDFNGMHQEIVKGEWLERGVKRSDKIISFLYLKKETKE